MQTATTMHRHIGTRITVRTDCGPVPMVVVDVRDRFGKTDVRVVADGINAADARWVTIDRTDAPKAADAR